MQRPGQVQCRFCEPACCRPSCSARSISQIFLCAALTGSPQYPSSKQAAVVQDLARRHNVSCPAHPAHQGHGAPDHLQMAVQLESTFAAPSFEPPKHSSSARLHGSNYTADLDALIHRCSESGGSWADFCIKHDTNHRPPRQHRLSHRAAALQARQSQLQAIFCDINVAKAVAKDPFLLKYTPGKLKQHMEQLQTLMGKDEASAMVTRMPALLHYRTSTLLHKLDDLYDLLPDADVGKVQQCHLTFVYKLHWELAATSGSCCYIGILLLGCTVGQQTLPYMC